MRGSKLQIVNPDVGRRTPQLHANRQPRLELPAAQSADIPTSSECLGAGGGGCGGVFLNRELCEE